MGADMLLLENLLDHVKRRAGHDSHEFVAEFAFFQARVNLAMFARRRVARTSEAVADRFLPKIHQAAVGRSVLRRKALDPLDRLVYAAPGDQRTAVRKDAGIERIGIDVAQAETI